MKSHMKQTVAQTPTIDVRSKSFLVTVLAYAALFATWLVYQLA